MFRFTRRPSSGSHSQYVAKIAHLVRCGYIELVQEVVSVMAAQLDSQTASTSAHRIPSTLIAD